MINYIQYLNIPTKIAIIFVIIFFLLQVIGEFLEFKGKAVPEFVKIRKYFQRKKQERQDEKQTLQEVKKFLADVNNHYSADNIAKRDGWMKWVNDRAEVYDKSIEEINEKLNTVTKALKDNTSVTEELFVQSSRDRIIDFATKISNDNVFVSREEFNRIFKIYKKYENFLEERELTNGEIDINFHIIKESYENHMKNHTFAENVRGYDT